MGISLLPQVVPVSSKKPISSNISFSIIAIIITQLLLLRHNFIESSTFLATVHILYLTKFSGSFGLFRALCWLQITFWFRAYVFGFGLVLVGPFATLVLIIPPYRQQYQGNNSGNCFYLTLICFGVGVRAYLYIILNNLNIYFILAKDNLWCFDCS